MSTENTQLKTRGAVASTGLLGERCGCGAMATGRMTDGSPRCCAACAFDPRGCRCKYGDPPNTPDDSAWMVDVDDAERDLDQSAIECSDEYEP